MDSDFFSGLMKASPGVPEIINIPLDHLLFRLLVAFALGCVIAAIYRFTQRPDTPASTGFVSTLVLLCILIAIVTQVVGDSPARAFSLVGILSIVRFRTVVEDTRDTAFVIFAVMIGMGTGIGNHSVALIGLAIVGSAAIILRYLPTIGTKAKPAWSLHLRVSTGVGGATPWESVLAKCCLATQLQSTATARQGASLDLTYRIQLKSDLTPLQLLNEINRIEGIQNLGNEARELTRRKGKETPMTRKHIGLLFLVALIALSSSIPVHAQKQKPAEQSAAYFKSDKILHLEIDLGKKELDDLRRDPRKYAKATLKDGKDIYPDIGIHVKGAAGSFRGIDDKPGLTLNMNKFDREKLFHGMDKWHLANSLQDPSYLSELLCGELFRAAGVPASRVHHAVVTINGRKRGLYYVKEGYDKHFLSQNFKNPNGNLYDGGFLREIDQPLQLLRTKDDVKDRADLKALTKASQEPNPKLRFEKLEKLLDMDKFISYLVLQVITWDWDGYPMNRNNYRIYHEPKLDKIIFLPSGMDQMFGNPGGPIMPGFQGLIAQKVMETPEGRSRYLARMKEIHTTFFAPDKLIKRLDELQARVQPELAKVDAGAGRDFPNQVNRLRNGIRERAKSMEQQFEIGEVIARLRFRAPIPISYLTHRLSNGTIATIRSSVLSH